MAQGSLPTLPALSNMQSHSVAAASRTIKCYVTSMWLLLSLTDEELQHRCGDEGKNGLKNQSDANYKDYGT